ncbi:MAG: ATP synthase F1 subunit delta [Acutalibacter sp.]|jgi:F-type H+-transporting ATPase subunit delta
MRTLETRYALALYELTGDEEGLRSGASLLMGEPELWQALLNPCIPVREKDGVLCRLLQGRMSQVDLDFFRLLCRRERLGLLPGILARFHQLKLEGEGGATAVYRCAREPDPQDLARIGEALKRRHGLSKVEFQVELDPELLGGFTIQIGGITYDKSVRGMLGGLRRSLKERE